MTIISERKSMLLRFLVLASISVVLGCDHYERKQTTYEEALRESSQQEQRLRAQQQREVEQRQARQRQAKLEIEQNLAQIRVSSVPENYKIQIDAHFVR